MKIDSKILAKKLEITFVGDCVAQYDADVDAIFANARRGKIGSVNIVAHDLREWDDSLVVILMKIVRHCRAQKIPFELIGFPRGVEKMVQMIDGPVMRPHADAPVAFLERIGERGINIWHAMWRGLVFVGNIGQSIGRFLRGTAQTRMVDWWFAFEDVGPRAILIVSLISFLIGAILAFVGAAQLKLFGAQVYVASLVAIASIRIMGAMMTGIIMAGRTGAAYAATIGTMQTNEELDALQTMGINKIDFLVLQRVIALAISMPILTLLADAMAIIGGAFIGVVMMGIPLAEYISYTTAAMGLQNFMVGVFHGFVYGIIIAICGCYYGINCGRNANSVGVATTHAVVSSIVWMVVATGIITFLFEVIGI